VSFRLLVIDDDQVVRHALKQILEKAGYDVTCAADGEQGLAAFRQRRPDLVITDIIMPETEGIEAIIEMRATTPHVPILAISGGGRIDKIDFLRIAKELGATDTMAKPFDADEFLVKVRACLKDNPSNPTA
jgi:DNA-binding response OmpR family regulator